ncbi:hypothetical protein [Azospirillum soli]|uniref:hypothetical protein n=1 Tax=Azospirillum soli TaxID=1304799 RepID=UPI001AEB4D4B|nr:hypothetical protein [Azospirillum soli]MBP2315457.1 hypothetical protein [Azospirillum soli]
MTLLLGACVQNGSAVSGSLAYCRGPSGDAYQTRGRCLLADQAISQAEYRDSAKRQQSRTMASAPAHQQSQAACVAYVDADARKRTDVPALLKTIGSMKLSKDEFETTPAYEARVAAAVERLTATLSAQTGSAPVVLDISLSASVATYDADRGVLEITGAVVPMTTMRADGRYRTVIVTDKLDHDISTYTGQNAYGAKAEVVKVRDRQAGVVVDETSDPGRSGHWPYSSFKATVALSPDRARAAKASLRAVVMGDLRAPFLVRGNDYITPTFQVPFDKTTETLAVVLQPKCSLIYNAATRDVYWP